MIKPYGLFKYFICCLFLIFSQPCFSIDEKYCTLEEIFNRYYIVSKKAASSKAEFKIRKYFKDLSTVYYLFSTDNPKPDPKNSNTNEVFLYVDKDIKVDNLISLNFKPIDLKNAPEEALWILNGASFEKCGFQNFGRDGFLSFKTNDKKPDSAQDKIGLNPRLYQPREFKFLYEEKKESNYGGANQLEKFYVVGKLELSKNSAIRYNAESNDPISLSVEDVIDLTDSIVKHPYQINTSIKRYLVTAGGVTNDMMWKDSDPFDLKVRDVDTEGYYGIDDVLMLFGINASYVDRPVYSRDEAVIPESYKKAQDNLVGLSKLATESLEKIKSKKRMICYGDKIKLLSTSTWKHLFGRLGQNSRLPFLSDKSGIIVLSSDFNPSHDQFGLNEDESWWIIRDSGEPSSSVKVGDFVLSGSKIRLENVRSGKFLSLSNKSAEDSFGIKTSKAQWKSGNLVLLANKDEQKSLLDGVTPDVWTIASSSGDIGNSLVVGDIFSLSSTGGKKT